MSTKIFSQLQAAKKALSLFALAALFVSGFAALSHVPAARAQGELIEAVSLVPETGTVLPGRTLDVYFEAVGEAPDITLNGQCLVNGVEVSSTFANLANGLYRVKYVVGENDSSRAAGQVPISCELKNSTGDTETVTAFTDGNTLAITAGEDEGEEEIEASQSPEESVGFSSVYANPSTGTRTSGEHFLVYLQSSTSANDLSLGGSCTINGVSVAPLENLGNGTYRLDYTVGSNDSERAPGTVPINCVIQNSSGTSTTVVAFTDGNTVAIDTNNDGSVTPPVMSTSTPAIAWASVTPGSGVLTLGDTAAVYFQESSNHADLEIAGACTINGAVISTLDNLDAGLYRLNYTVAEGHPDRGSGMIPISCALANQYGTTTIDALDTNSLSVDVNGNGDYTDGQVDQGSLAVTSIEQVKTTATAGGEFDGGWEWVFSVTIPENEKFVRIKLGDWLDSSASTTIEMGGNTRVSSEQASSTEAAMMPAAGIFSASLEMISDLDSETPGLQVRIRIEMRIPEGVAVGSYGTYYGIQSSDEALTD